MINIPILWLIHAGITAVLLAPIVYLGRKRVHWRRCELLVFVIPFGVWLALCSTGIVNKSEANSFEPVILSLAVSIAALIRLAIGTRISENVCIASLIAAVSAVASGVYFFIPGLPE